MHRSLGPEASIPLPPEAEAAIPHPINNVECKSTTRGDGVDRMWSAQ